MPETITQQIDRERAEFELWAASVAQMTVEEYRAGQMAWIERGRRAREAAAIAAGFARRASDRTGETPLPEHMA